jgi:methylated-DNA-[protein]-cysteine S-methyltransferase
MGNVPILVRKDGQIAHPTAGLLTPTGPFWVQAQDGAIIRAGWGKAPAHTDDPILTQALTEIAAYFAGSLTQFSVPLNPQVTGFQFTFLHALIAIPFGETRTYGQLAKHLNTPAQAIGQACGANPIPLLIPCHRVLGATTLGGYSGGQGVETKIALLKHEGAAGLLL